MAITWGSQLGHSSTGTAALTRVVTLTAAPAATDQVLVAAGANGIAVSSIADSRGNTWTVVKAGAAARPHLWRTTQDVAALQVGDQVTITFASSATSDAALFSVAGLSAGTPPDASATTSAASGTTLSAGPTGTTVLEEELAVSVLHVRAGQTSVTQPSGYALRGTGEQNVNGMCLAVATKVLSALGTESVTWSWATSGNVGVLVATLRSATVTAAATFSAPAGLTAGVTDTVVAAATFSAPADLSAAAVVTEVLGAAFTAPAALTVGVVATEVLLATFTAPANLQAVLTVTELAAAAFTAPAGLTVGVTVTELLTATLSAPAALAVDVAGAVLVAATFTAPAELAVGVTDDTAAVATLSAPAELTVAVTDTAAAAATFAAPATLTVGVSLEQQAAAIFTAPATLTADAVHAHPAAATFTAAAELEVGLAAVAALAALFTAPAVLTTGVLVESFTVALFTAAAELGAALAAYRLVGFDLSRTRAGFGFRAGPPHLAGDYGAPSFALAAGAPSLQSEHERGI